MIVFVIVGKGDIPIYHYEFRKPSDIDDASRTDQFLIHAALDTVDELIWQQSTPFLKLVDSSEKAQIFAYVTPGHARFMLYIDDATAQSEAFADSFFKQVHESFVKVWLSHTTSFLYPFVGCPKPILRS
jgi:hypothetical protein